jgi:hypothetical protein
MLTCVSIATYWFLMTMGSAPMPVTEGAYLTQDVCEAAGEVADQTFSVHEIPWLALQRPFVRRIGQEPANEPLAASRELGR